MGLTVQLLGTLRDGSMPAGWLHRLQQWLHDEWSRTLVGSAIQDAPQGRHQLLCQLHPAASDICLRICGPHEIALTAATAAVGPGYHAHVCDLLHRIGDELAVDWSPGEGGGDPTGFLASGSVQQLEAAIIADLQSRIRKRLAQPEATDFAPLNLEGRHEYGGSEAAVTPLGPRSREWLRRACTDGDIARDILPWWDLGGGASYRLGRALTEMWLNVRWRRPINDEEAGLVDRVVILLESAYAANPRLDFPWPEWRQLQDHSWHQVHLPPHPPPNREASIGYRRRPVRVHLADGWALVIPGTCAERWDDETTFQAWDGKRTVWVSTSRHDAADAEAALRNRPLPPGRPLALPSSGSTVRRGVAYEVEEPALVHKIDAHVAVAGQLAHVTLVFAAPEDEAWAVETITSLENNESSPSP